MRRRASSKRKNQFVIPLGNAWGVKGEGNQKFSIISDSKRDAVDFAKAIAINNHSDLIVYGKTGRIVEMNSYAKAPRVKKTTKTQSIAK